MASTKTTLLVVSAILVALHAAGVRSAPSNEASAFGIEERIVRKLNGGAAEDLDNTMAKPIDAKDNEEKAGTYNNNGGMNGGNNGGNYGNNGANYSNNKPSGNYGNNGGDYGNKPNGNYGNNGGKPNGNYGNNGGDYGNKPNGNYGNNGGKPSGNYGNNGGKPSGNYGNNGGDYNNKPNGNYGNNGGDYSNKPNGNYGNNSGKPNGNYGNNGGDYGNNNGGSNYGSNNGGDSYEPPEGSYAPYDTPFNGNGNSNGNVNGNGNGETSVMSTTTRRPPTNHVGFGAVANSFWDMVISFIRAAMGIQRRQPPRIARAFLAAAAGREQCIKTSACHAGRMMRSFLIKDQEKKEDKEVYFVAAEMLSPEGWKPFVRGIRRSALEDEDCSKFKCNV